MSEPSKPHHADTQAQRRVKYGLNVAVAAAAAVVIALLLNWVAYRNNLRYDFTVTREYTLSPQTKQVVANLDGDVEIVTVFPLDTVQLQRVDNLVKEYARASGKVTARHVDPSAQPTEFYQGLRDRFAEANQPLADAIAAGRAALTDAQTQMKAMLDPLTAAADEAGTGGDEAAQIKDRLLEVWIVLTQLDQQVTQTLDDVKSGLESPLPDYDRVRSALVTMMGSRLESGVLAQIQTLFGQLKNLPATPNAVKNTLIELGEQIEPLRAKLRESRDALSGAEGSESYAQLRQTVASTASVIVFKGANVQAIPVTAMFPDQALLQQADTDRDARFLGEERLTGALMSLSMDQPPMLVFVINNQISAMGQRGMYNHVAGRLQSVGFDVRQWNPQGQTTPDGRMAPPMPPPQPADGQRAVWIFLPRVPAGPMDFMSVSAGEQIASMMEEKLAAGDGVMVMFLPDPSARLGATDPVNTQLDPWGLTVQLDRVVLELVQLPDGKSQANNLLQINDWPADLPVTQALKGMGGLFYQASPIVVGQAEGVTSHPIAVASGSRLWAERDFAGLQSMGDATYDEAEAADTFTLGVAAEKGDARLVVVADPAWASDNITTYGRIGQYQGAGLADLGGALYPANAELFVNSALWLAHMDQMIAASPRSQDIRRIEPMDDATLTRYRWLLGAGLPAAVLLVGLTAWFVRRKG